ncbi:MAG: Holliday junction branch migration protein RuvA [Elusimicrobia bacterium]|nr:Holliday junction branch migration protein RuvA [Elusimicrobiota bacterium]
MIAFLRGSVFERGDSLAVIEAGGVGYEVHLTPTSLARLAPGQPAEIFISESVAMYGGGTSLYGFLTREEREVFHQLREHVPGTGAKKALEHLDKASRSFPDFRRAILEGDVRMLAEVFGFTKKTAERLAAALKDKLGESVPRGGSPRADAPSDGAMSQALDALASLGYKPAEARTALQAVSTDLGGKRANVEEILRLALKRL